MPVRWKSWKSICESNKKCCNSAIFEPNVMKFCIQRSLAQPGKHAQFQQGCRGCKAKCGKAIKAGGQNFQKSFFQLFCASVCALHPFLGISPISLKLGQLPTVVSLISVNKWKRIHAWLRLFRLKFLWWWWISVKLIRKYCWFHDPLLKC